MDAMRPGEVRDCILMNGVYSNGIGDPVPTTLTNTMSRNGSSGVQVEEVADLTEWMVIYIITPSVSLLGVIGNILSLIILAKHGLHKSSNILLFCLAVSHILFVIAINAGPKSLYEWSPRGFPYSELTAHILYYLYQLADYLNWVTRPTSMCIPGLIMLERLIAVFLPLRFPTLVTVPRTVIAVSMPLVFSILLQVYLRNWFRFAYVFDPSRNMTVGIAERTQIYWNHRQVRSVIEVCMNLLFILVFFVGCGCVAIGVKMKLVSRKRLRMTNSVRFQKVGGKKDAESSRTTKMLLCVCTFYTCACTPSILPAIVPSFMTDPLFLDKPNYGSLGVFTYHVYNLVFCVNASCNFFICIGANKKFRQTFVDLLHVRWCHFFRRLFSVE